MIPDDVIELKRLLTALANVMPRAKPLAAEAVQLWHQRLRTFTLDEVCAFLQAWPDRHREMPTIEEALQGLAEARRQAQRQLEAEAERQRTAQPAADPSCPEYRAAMDRIRALQTRPRPAPTDWLEQLRARERAGERLMPIQHEMLRAVSKKNRVSAPPAVETEAEREARLEREAIQAEGCGQPMGASPMP